METGDRRWKTGEIQNTLFFDKEETLLIKFAE